MRGVIVGPAPPTTTSVFDTVIDLVRSELAQNQFLSGGVVLAALSAVAATCWRAVPLAWSFAYRRLVVTLDVHSRDDAYDMLRDWIAEQPYAKKARLISAESREVYNRIDLDGDPAQDEAADRRSRRLRRHPLKFVPAPGVHLFVYRGRLVWLTRDRRWTPGEGGVASMYETAVLRMLGRNRDVLKGLMEEARAASVLKDVDRVVIYANAEYGEWVRVGRRLPRPAHTLILPHGQLERALADVRKFMRSRARYAELGTPYRRGYLFTGPPGTGKSTMAMVMAGEIGADLYTLNLQGSSLTDESLLGLLRRVPPHSVVLLEDVDAAFHKRSSKKDGKSRLTFRGLLNAIDGVASPEGIILIMTTNHPEKLDPALVRPGRVDYRDEIGYVTPDQARRLFLRFFPGAEPQARVFAATVPDHVTPAQLQEHFLMHELDPESALTLPIDAIPAAS